MASVSVVAEMKENPGGEDLMAMLRKFIETYNNVSRLQLDPYVITTEIAEAVREGFYLMKHLSSSRPAVMTFLGEIYYDFVEDAAAHQENMEYRPKFVQDSDFAILDEIKSAILSLLETYEAVWCPIISKWVLELLANFSRTLTGRQAIPAGGRLPQVIPSWTQFKVIQNLLEISQHCFHDTSKHKEVFVATLLETLTRHTPHFDWILTCLNKSTHETMVNGVLSLGLKNFRSTNGQLDEAQRSEDKTVPVINSDLLVTILGQLVASHSEEVKYAFETLAQIKLNTDDIQVEIPFLLKLCSSSRASFALIDTLVGCIVGQVNHQEKFSRLLSLTCDWLRTEYPAQGAAECMTLNLVTHLMIKSTRSVDLIRILFIGSKTWEDPHRTRAFCLLYNFISEITRLTFDSDVHLNELSKLFPSIASLSKSPDFLIDYLIQSNGESRVCRASLQLIKILALFYNEGLGKRSISSLLCGSTQDIHIWTLIELINALSTKYPNILRECLKNVIVSSKPQLDSRFNSHPNKNQPWKIIVRILNSEHLKKTPFYFNLVTALQSEFKSLSLLLDSRRTQICMKQAALILEILSEIPILVNNVPTGSILTMMDRIVDLLFIILGDTGEDEKTLKFCKKNRSRLICCLSSILDKLLKKSDQRLIFRIFIIRRMVQSFLDPHYRKLFHALVSISLVNDEEDKTISQFTTTLMIENRKRVSTVTPGSIVPQTFQRSNFKRSQEVIAKKYLALDNPEAEKNVQIFFSVLMLACCMPSNLKNGSSREERLEDMSNGGECNYIEDCGFSIGLDFMRQVALLFVEIVSPDVMLNGLPWPDLEYSKMLIERDLHIQRTFEDYPYFWYLLELLAKYRPSLCYCSVIVRALMATFIQRWRSAQQTKAVSNPRLLECTIRLLGVMKIGQFIPPPFCYLGEILSELQSREIVGLLEDVWSYMRMHVPVRLAFTQSAVSKNFVRTWETNDFDPFAMDRLRFTILKHAEQVGFLLGQFFPPPAEPETPASPDPGT